MLANSLGAIMVRTGLLLGPRHVHDLVEKSIGTGYSQ